MSIGTPKRPIRISDDLWAKAQEKAQEMGTNVAAVIRASLEEWVDELTYATAPRDQPVLMKISGYWRPAVWDEDKGWTMNDGHYLISESEVDGVRRNES